MLDFLSYNFRYRYRLYNVETDAAKKRGRFELWQNGIHQWKFLLKVKSVNSS